MRHVLLLLACGCGSARVDEPPAKPRQAAPVSAPVSATRACVAGGELVFENDCGCNDGILCSIASATSPTLAVTLVKDPSRMPMCDDCFAMVPGRCALPALAGGTWHVTINQQPAFDLVAPAADGTCWTIPRVTAPQGR